MHLFVHHKRRLENVNTNCGGGGGDKVNVCVCLVVQLLSHVQLFTTPWTTAHQASLSFTISQSLLKLMSIEPMMPSNHLILQHPLPLLPSVFPSIRIFSSELALCIRWPKYWSFSISPSNEYSELISFSIDWFDLLPVQGTLQHRSLKASVLRCSAFFMVQLLQRCMTTGKTVALTPQTFVGKVMSLCVVVVFFFFNFVTCSQYVIECFQVFMLTWRKGSHLLKLQVICLNVTISYQLQIKMQNYVKYKGVLSHGIFVSTIQFSS